MIRFPNAKINLGLNVIGRRSDGFHDIETVMAPVRFCDILEIIPSHGEGLEFSQSGIKIPGAMSENLCAKAYRLFAKRRDLQGTSIHLHKVIPPGSGLGGGSSDAAFCLRLLNEVYRTALSDRELEVMAAELGSDCPFFIRNKAVFATGRGEVMEEMTIPLHDRQIVLVIPGIHVSTAWAYSRIKPSRPGISVKEIVQGSLSSWKEILINDFEAPVFEAHPTLKRIREQLYLLGAAYAALSGSGSAMYGIFDDVPANVREMFPGSQVLVADMLM